ncbi:hypothetical protein [Ktedonobacter sp. SOSP1-52]|nr:hypothetical protein [Ktedonobacter sp. SOSP1-52]
MFGATGDLAQRKLLPTLAHLCMIIPFLRASVLWPCAAPG